MIRPKHIREDRITLDQKSHTYFIDSKDGYKSVTETIKSFFPPFKKHAIISCLMKKTSKTWHQIEDEWIKKREFGTLMHNQIEEFLNTNQWSCDDPDIITCRNQFINFWQNLDRVHKIKNFRPEMKIFDEEYKIAGSIDLLVEFEDGACELFDWKCIPILRTSGYCRGYHPFENYDDTNHSHYLIQLNMYKFILEKYYDIVISKIHIVQFNPCLDDYKQHTLIHITEDIKRAMEVKPSECEPQSIYKKPLFFSNVPKVDQSCQ